ncbi:MAG TPA: ABC transporter permease [Blastocatellia bacterium]|nr:ABC transporter permease [Blastocatellia bacterium]
MPDWRNEIRQRLAGLRLEPMREDEIIEELSQHLDDRYAERRAAGASIAEARRAALNELSSSEILRQELRRVERRVVPEPVVFGSNRRINMLADLWQDLRFGARLLLKQPGFTFIALLTLCLGIGATTAIFSVVNAVLLKPLPYAQPEQLMIVYGNFPALNASPMRLSLPEYVDLQQQTRSFAVSGVFDSSGSANLAPDAGGMPERVERAMLTPTMFAVLQAAPLRGRIFTAEEAQAGRDNVVVLSYGLWQRRYAGRADVIGQEMVINGRNSTIIGVMPPEFAFPPRAEIWQPLWFPAEMYDQQRRGARGLEVLARLQPGISMRQAQAELEQLGAQLTEQYPQNYGAERRYQMLAAPLLEDYVGELKPALLLLAGAVLFVLLIACANVANLLLTRAATRRQELAVRLALGAGRGRLLRQLLTESVLLALAGGAAGLLLAVWGVQWLLRFVPDNLPRFSAVAVDGRVLAFTALASLLTGVIFGLAPALQATRAEVNEALRESGRTGTGAPRLRNAFVVAEVALALVLLAGAGLTLKSFWRLQAVEPGFNPDGVLTFRMLLPFTTHPQTAQRTAFFGQVLTRLRALPGVASAGAVSRIPMAPGDNSGTMTGENSAIGPNDPQVETEMRWASPAYFQTMGITLLSGRDFSDADAEGAPPVAIVDESFVRRFYPNEDPIGKRIKRGGPRSTRPWKTIVGVVRSVRNQRLDATSLPQAYFPVLQEADEMYNLSFAIRVSGGEPAALAESVRGAVLAVDPGQPIFDVKPLRQIVSDSVALKRLALLLLSLFAGVALVLAASGIYGVMSYSVTQRTREIGLRMALGAQAVDVLRLVVRQGLQLALIGVALGLAAALALTRLLKALLFGVSATDPLTLAGIALLLLSVALIACFVPARRATRIDPLAALRYE